MFLESTDHACKCKYKILYKINFTILFYSYFTICVIKMMYNFFQFTSIYAMLVVVE